MRVVVYSTNCPQCHALEMMLKQKHIEPEIVMGADMIIKLGYRSAPIMQVDDVIMSYAEAVRWVKEYQEEVKADDLGQVSPVQEGPELHQEVLQCAECGVGQ